MNTPEIGSEICDLPCPIETTLKVIGGKWKALILFHLQSGPKRFNQLRRLIPKVTQRMITTHLRELERDGIVYRQVFDRVPPHVEYSLTELGWSITPLLSAMATWGKRYEAIFPERLERAAKSAGEPESSSRAMY
ncbi:MAG: helix-turn-helix domain-containing protein [Nodosilinea sp.]